MMDYSKHYNLLIERAKERSLTCYMEKHHIVPRCIGGKDNKENLVSLTPEEHYIAHLLLVKMFPGNTKLVFSANMMLVGQKRKNNKVHGWLRRKTKQAISISNSGKVPHNLGKKHRPEDLLLMQTRWKFIHPCGKEEIANGLKDFCEKHNLNPSAMCGVCKGKRSHHKGFRVVKLDNITESDNLPYINKPKQRGHAAHNRKPVLIDGVRYDSVDIARRALGFSYEKVTKLNEFS